MMHIISIISRYFEVRTRHFAATGAAFTYLKTHRILHEVRSSASRSCNKHLDAVHWHGSTTRRRTPESRYAACRLGQNQGRAVTENLDSCAIIFHAYEVTCTNLVPLVARSLETNTGLARARSARAVSEAAP
jgi:hypothetical protein